jgi:hypothetical protein
MVACLEAGNDNLAQKVANGEIPPYYVNDEGHYVGDLNRNLLPNASLPCKHPLIKHYDEVFEKFAKVKGG